MATYYQYYWNIQDLAAVCALQNTIGAGNLLLNGTYAAPPSITISFIGLGFTRQVSLTSVNNLSGANFTVSGVQNNTVVTEILSGPNNDTVSTTNSFDVISSVSVDSAVTGVSVGTGLSGFFPIIGRISTTTVSLSAPSSNYALSFATEASNGCTYQIYHSLADLRSPPGTGTTNLNLIATQQFISVDGPYSNITQILQESDISNNILVRVTSAVGASTLNMEFLQL